MMSAQDNWKSCYKLFVIAILLERNGEADDWRESMRRYRREAALEREVESRDRRITCLLEKNREQAEDIEILRDERDGARSIADAAQRNYANLMASYILMSDEVERLRGLLEEEGVTP